MTHGGYRPGAGRPKGAPNKRTQELTERLDEFGCDSLAVTAMFAMGDVVGLGYMTQEEFDANPAEARKIISPDLRASMAKELNQYRYPKRRALEHSADDDRVLEISWVSPKQENTSEIDVVDGG